MKSHFPPQVSPCLFGYNDSEMYQFMSYMLINLVLYNRKSLYRIWMVINTGSNGKIQVLEGNNTGFLGERLATLV